MSRNILLTMAGWEPRFLASSLILLDELNLDFAHVVYSTKFADLTASVRDSLRSCCSEYSCDYVEHAFDFENPVSSWRFFRDLISSFDELDKVHLDFTTMPRECIWSILIFLEKKKIVCEYFYSRPKKYSNWLTRSPQEPRLMLTMSGVTKIGAPTALIIFPGFDLERTRQLIFTYDPSVTILCFQKGSQYNNQECSVVCHEKLMLSATNCKSIAIDAYVGDHGEDDIRNIIIEYSDYNIVLASLGPKPSAIALYNLQREFQSIALSYAPSSEINPEYSYGWSGMIHGKF